MIYRERPLEPPDIGIDYDQAEALREAEEGRIEDRLDRRMEERWKRA